MAGRKEDDVDPHIRAVWHETRGEQFGRHGNAGETRWSMASTWASAWRAI
jgi:hypothetical protein